MSLVRRKALHRFSLDPTDLFFIASVGFQTTTLRINTDEPV